MALDSSDVDRLASEIRQLRLRIERTRSPASQLDEINRVLQNIESKIGQQSGGSD